MRVKLYRVIWVCVAEGLLNGECMKEILFLTVFLFWGFCLQGQNADLCIDGVDVVVSESVCVSGSLFDRSGGGLKLNSELSVRNLEECEIVLSSGSDLVSASLCLMGQANTFLDFYSSGLKSLELGMSEGDLYLSGHLLLSSRLSLFSGRVVDGGSGLITLTNPSGSSLVFDNVRGNESYLAVGLSRSVIPGQEYYYPVGDQESYHPFFVSDLEEGGQVTVSYSSSVDEQWADVALNDYFVFPFSGAWLVEDDGLGVSFMAGMARLDRYSDIIEKDLDVFYMADPVGFAGEPVVDRFAIEVNDYFLSPSEKYGAGMYSLIESAGVNAGEEELELVNVIVADQETQTYFVVPEAEKYERISIAVYDSWGRVVFRSDEYMSEMNCRDFPSGTYYYHMKAILGDGSEVVKNDIIEVVRKR